MAEGLTKDLEVIIILLLLSYYSYYSATNPNGYTDDIDIIAKLTMICYSPLASFKTHPMHSRKVLYWYLPISCIYTDSNISSVILIDRLRLDLTCIQKIYRDIIFSVDNT